MTNLLKQLYGYKMAYRLFLVISLMPHSTIALTDQFDRREVSNGLMDLFVIYQTIKQHKEKCILYASISAGIGLLLMALFALLHVFIERKRKNLSTVVISQSPVARPHIAEDREVRTPLYPTYCVEEEETVGMSIDRRGPSPQPSPGPGYYHQRPFKYA